MTMYRKWPIQGSASAGPLVVIMNQACVWWRTWSQWFNVNTKVFQSTDDKVALFPWATQEYKPKKLAALRQLAQTQSPGAVAHMTEKRWRFWTRSAEGPFNMTKKRASFVAFLPFTYTRMVPGVPKSANFWNRDFRVNSFEYVVVSSPCKQGALFSVKTVSQKYRTFRSNNSDGWLSSNTCAANGASFFSTPLTKCEFATSLLWPAVKHLLYSPRTESVANFPTYITSYWPSILATPFSVNITHRFHTVSRWTQIPFENTEENLLCFW